MTNVDDDGAVIIGVDQTTSGRAKKLVQNALTTGEMGERDCQRREV